MRRLLIREGLSLASLTLLPLFDYRSGLHVLGVAFSHSGANFERPWTVVLRVEPGTLQVCVGQGTPNRVVKNGSTYTNIIKRV